MPTQGMLIYCSTNALKTKLDGIVLLTAGYVKFTFCSDLNAYFYQLYLFRKK
jgi:hypothetical protein